MKIRRSKQKLMLIISFYMASQMKRSIYSLDPPRYSQAKSRQVCKLLSPYVDLSKHCISGTKKYLSSQCNMIFDHLFMILLFLPMMNLIVFLVILLYVDDMLITGSNDICIPQLNQVLYDMFTIKDLGLACFFLSLKL